MQTIVNHNFLSEISTILVESDTHVVTPMLEKGRLDANMAEIVQKGVIGANTKDYFTAIDGANETWLLNRFASIVPGSFTIGEESFDQDPQTNLDLLSTSPYAWVLDPIDGTNNVVDYLNGKTEHKPRYGIMAALLHYGEPVGGWILTSDDKGEKTVLCAGTDLGAHAYDINENALKSFTIPQPSQDAVPHIVTTVSAWPSAYRPILNERTAAGSFDLYATPPKSAAHEMTLLLQGKVDAAAFRQFRAWDHIPGMVIVNEAGGKVDSMNNDGIALADQRKKGILATARADAWHETRQAILGAVAYTHTEDPKPSSPSASSMLKDGPR